jgi:hypothetical protein
MRRFTTRRARKAGLPPGTPVHIGDAAVGETGVTAIAYDEAGVRETGIADIGACRALKDAAGACWINLDGIHDVGLLHRLGQDFGLHPLVLEDIANTEQRPKLEDYGDYLYLVVKMLSMNGEAFTVEQVSLVLGKSYLLSFQEQGKPGDVFDPIRARLRSGRAASALAAPIFSPTASSMRWSTSTSSSWNAWASASRPWKMCSCTTRARRRSGRSTACAVRSFFCAVRCGRCARS